MEDRKYRQLDAIRFFNFISVLSVHWACSVKPYADLIGIGSRAMELFFLISGFLITLILLKAKNSGNSTRTSLGRFYARRTLRIFPIYYIFILIMWLFNHAKIADSIWWNLCYVSNFYTIKTQQFGGVGHLWSLAVEEQFYLVWPLIILLVSRRYLPYVMTGCVLLSLGVKSYWWLSNSNPWLALVHPVGVLDTLALGGLLAYLYYYHQEKLRQWLYDPYITAVIVTLSVLCLSCRYFPSVDFIYHIGVRTFWGLFCLWLTGRAVFGFTGITGRIFEFKPFIYIGKISYSMYLFHILVPGMFLGLKYPHQIDLRFIFFFAVIVAIGTVSWYCVESPILRLKERFQ